MLLVLLFAGAFHGDTPVSFCRVLLSADAKRASTVSMPCHPTDSIPLPTTSRSRPSSRHALPPEVLPPPTALSPSAAEAHRDHEQDDGKGELCVCERE